MSDDLTIPSFTGAASPAAGRWPAVLFDVDGTLIDTAELIADSLAHACRRHLGTDPPHEALYRLIGQPAIIQMEILGGRGDVCREMLQSAIEYYEAHAHREQPFPGALDTLAQLRERGVRLGLVTSKLRIELDPTLLRIPLQDYVEVIVTADMTSRPKPFPDPVYLALQTLEVAAEQVLFVGDSPYDLEAGRAAGVRTGAATWGPHPRERLSASAPDFIFENFSALLRACQLD